MHAKVQEYKAILRGMQENLWFRIVAFFVSGCVFYDLFLSQFIPKEYAEKAPKVWESAVITGGLLPWWGWLLVLSGMLVIGSFEYAGRIHRAHTAQTPPTLAERAEQRTEPAEREPVAWLKEWHISDVIASDDVPCRRVDLTPSCEPWLKALNPTITPLGPIASPPLSSGEQPAAEVDSRSRLRRIAAQKGDPIPTWPADEGDEAEYELAELHKENERICELHKGLMKAAEDRAERANALADSEQHKAQMAESALAEAWRDAKRYKTLARRRHTELRRLNKYLGPYWSGFRRGTGMEAECKLRGIMNATFGHAAVHAAEHAAIDAAMGEREKG